MPHLSFEPIVVPLREDDQGAIRIGGTRMLLDLIVRRFREGARPESFVESYEESTIRDVYAVLTHYLDRTDAIDAYLRCRDAEAHQVRQQIEAAPPEPPRGGDGSRASRGAGRGPCSG
jgi:uncharacterized protein (DUF433 family)